MQQLQTTKFIDTMFDMKTVVEMYEILKMGV